MSNPTDSTEFPNENETAKEVGNVEADATFTEPAKSAGPQYDFESGATQIQFATLSVRELSTIDKLTKAAITKRFADAKEELKQMKLALRGDRKPRAKKVAVEGAEPKPAKSKSKNGARASVS